MQKSKSWLKSLLIVIMAIMLVFSLVACNKGDDKDGPVETESSADYFNALWSATKPIGTAQINDNADLAISFGFELSIDTYDEYSDGIYQQIDLGFDVHAVVGRTKDTAGNTAVKLRLYDPTDKNYAEIATLYAFADDLDNLYIDFAGKNIKLPHNMETLIWNEIFGHDKDSTAGEGLADLMSQKNLPIGGENRSVNDLINMFTADFGEDWSLNSIVDKVLTILNFDANKIIELIKDKGLEVVVKNLFRVNRLEDLLDNGKLDVLKILSSDALNGFLSATKQRQKGGAVVHTASLNNIVGLALGFVGDAGETISDMIYQKNNNDEITGGEVALRFSEKNGAIQDLSVYAQLLGSRMSVIDQNGKNHSLIPELSFKITEFGIQALKEDKSNGVALKADKSAYSDTVAFDETVELEAHGIQILKLNDNDSDIYLNGKIIVNAKGQLDIVNTNKVIKDNANITENKTKANVTVQLVNGSDAPKTLVQASYANGKFAVKAYDGFDLGKIDEKWAGKTGIVYDLGKDFNVADAVQSCIREFIEGMQPEGSAAAIPPANLTLADKIKGAMEVALSMVSTPDNHLHISTSNILETVILFKESVNPGSTGTDGNKWTEQNRIVAIVNSLLNINPLYADKTLGECIDILNEQSENSDWRDALNICGDVARRILEIVGPKIRIDGVATTGLKASDYADFKKADGTAITANDTDLMIYINNIKAVLATSITIDGDLQGGIHASISINIANATLSASASFTIVDDASFVNLYNDYVLDSKDTTKAQAWVYIQSEKE